MSHLPRGLYEMVLTDLLAERLNGPNLAGTPEYEDLRNAEAADRIALHLSSVVERAIREVPEKDRAKVSVGIARRLIEYVVGETGSDSLIAERPTEHPQILQSVRGRLADGQLEAIEVPLIPLLDTTLLTNAPGEPRVGRQIQMEIASADRIDLVMAFVRRTGIAPLRERLQRHVESGRSLRVLTTVYTGSTESEALDLLRSLGAEIRVSYDTTSTRLHAKAWLFHRESGFSTAYVGSSNLTHSAQVSGLEWNVRLSAARNRSVIDKIAAVFESYWQQPDFEPFDTDRFASAVHGSRSASSGLTLSPIEVRLWPFQERLLEQIELARDQGYHRNLLVAATGTGKTVMAAVDYARLRSKLPRARLLFIAHRKEILEQSRRTFAQVLRDSNFGELWVGDERPTRFDHVFASIQSLNSSGMKSVDPGHFDVVIVDEFHHAAAASYTRLLEDAQPRELIGLTATPERSDGLDILGWFGGRIAAELRLWDAIDQNRLTPFTYFGIADDLDFREIPWKKGRGYDVDGVANLIVATDVWARRVLKEFVDHVGKPDRVRALGFCVNVEHARYMARVFNENGVAAVAVWAGTIHADRSAALKNLRAGRISVVFSVDLFNEGVDVPEVDCLLMLRPTDSSLIFLQQLGRGLRKSEGKSVCTVLDFVGLHRREFRFYRRFQALLGGSRSFVASQLEQGFPFLPAGCHMELDRVSSDRVLANIRASVPTRWRDKADELRKLNAENPGVTLGRFLELSGYELEDIYRPDKGWSDLCEEAGINVLPAGAQETKLRRAIGRMLHVDDPERLKAWRSWLSCDAPPIFAKLSVRDRRMLLMLLVQLFDQIADSNKTIAWAAELLWGHRQVRVELMGLLDVLQANIQHISPQLDELTDVPLRVRARYTRQEILCACGENGSVKKLEWREGARYAKGIEADLFVFTLDKTSGQFSPTTRYRDFAISQDLIHWESQSGTREESATGKRYQSHAALGSHVLLFGRPNVAERAFHFLGPATYVSHEGELPMAVTWRLQHPLPGDLFQAYAVAVA